MCYEGGIKSFVTYLGEKRKLDVLHPNVIYLKGQTDRAWQRSHCSTIPATTSCC